MGLGLLFPGQGTQHPDMLPWLEQAPAAVPALRRLADAVGPAWRGRLADAAWATANAVAQPLLTAVNLAAWQALAPRLPPPIAIAGYSVGEVAAFAAAGVYDASTAMDIAVQRASAMDVAGAAASTGLLSVQGLPTDRLGPACQRFGLLPAILLDPEHTVVGGPRDALARAQTAFETLGARCTPVAVQIASHTAWMAAALPLLQAAVAPLVFRRPACAVVLNATGESERQPAALRQALVAQIAQPVPWQRCMDTLYERGVTRMLEVGPGTTLKRFWERRHPDVPVRSLEDFQSLDGIVRWAAEAR
jgi:[acyl-carrier-protein] S-malonyltransferase